MFCDKVHIMFSFSLYIDTTGRDEQSSV